MIGLGYSVVTDKTWKAVERRIMKALGGKRIPITGRQRGDQPDGEHEVFSIEIKHRAKLPQSWFDAMDQAVASSKDGKLPIVVWHEKGRREDLVMMRLSDFREWYGV